MKTIDKLKEIEQSTVDPSVPSFECDGFMRIFDLMTRVIPEEEDAIENVYIDGSNICLNPGYWIELKRCDTKWKLLQRVYHLTEKGWFSQERCRRFITLCCEFHGLLPFVVNFTD